MLVVNYYDYQPVTYSQRHNVIDTVKAYPYVQITVPSRSVGTLSGLIQKKVSYDNYNKLIIFRTIPECFQSLEGISIVLNE